MRVIYLPTFWTIIVDCIAWAIIQPGIAYLSIKLPPSVLDHRLWLFKTRAWEKEGKVYQELFHVKWWKSWLPTGGPLFPGGFPMKRLESRDPAYLRAWVLESCRAELCHWVAILPAFLFFLWNRPAVGVVMILYAIAFNAPLIIVQRHNRPRLLAILRKRENLNAMSQPRTSLAPL